MTEIVEKIAVKRMISARVPGKKYSRYPPSEAAVGSTRNELPRPEPKRSQNTIGVPSAPTIRNK